VEQLSTAEARRIALAAQGFGARRPLKAAAAQWRRTIDRLSLHQIDSVNILVRAHYLPAFSRLGPYDRSLIDKSAWGGRRQRRLFEYWAHEASLLPLELHPLLRWRMARADRGAAGWKGLRAFATERRAEAETLLKRIRNEGPRAASDFEEKRSRPGWWEWSDAKRALEWLFWAGHITTATRRGSYERVYDLTERVIPAEILALPTPDEGEAHRALIERAALALGVATATELSDYFRLGAKEAKSAIGVLVEANVLRPVAVPGWVRSRSCTATPAGRDASRPKRFSPLSTRSSGSGRAPSACSASTTGSRSTPRRTSGGTATMSCPSCSATGWWRGSTSRRTVRRAGSLSTPCISSRTRHPTQWTRSPRNSQPWRTGSGSRRLFCLRGPGGLKGDKLRVEPNQSAAQASVRQGETRVGARAAGASAVMRCYFVKGARIVAAEELPGVSVQEAIATARIRFDTSGSSYDGIEVWSPTRRIYKLGRISRRPKPARPKRWR